LRALLQRIERDPFRHGDLRAVFESDDPITRVDRLHLALDLSAERDGGDPQQHDDEPRQSWTKHERRPPVRVLSSRGVAADGRAADAEGHETTPSGRAAQEYEPSTARTPIPARSRARRADRARGYRRRRWRDGCGSLRRREDRRSRTPETTTGD